jgi:thiol-disulfide isomerase/thioredoxin
MMTIRTLMCLTSLVFAHVAAAASLQPYRTGDWKEVVQGRAGKPMIVHFWGVTCGPCLVELPKWGKFVREQRAANVVFIEVDQAPEKIALKRLADAKLEGAANRMLVSQYDEYMRFEIDPKWMGELPSTVLIDANGHARRISGVVDFGQLRAWLAREQALAGRK